MALKGKKMTSNQKLVFQKSKGKINTSNIENVMLKPKGSFKKWTLEDWGHTLLQDDEELTLILEQQKANNVANTEPRFDPSRMCKPEYRKLEELIWDEQIQRLPDSGNIRRIARDFDTAFFTPIACVKSKEFDKLIVPDGWHHAEDYYLEIRAGNIKGIHPDDWRDVKVPCNVWYNDDPTFPGRLALMLNGEGQLAWGPYHYWRLHSGFYSLHGSKEPEDELAYNQLMAVVNEGNSVPLESTHKDAKKPGVITHIAAIRKNSEDRLKFIMKMNEKYSPLEKRSDAMFGFYGEIYDDEIRNRRPLSGKAFDEKMNDYHAIIQIVFADDKGPGNLEKAKKAIDGGGGAIDMLEHISNKAWRDPSGDRKVLAVVEIIYKDYVKGPHPVSAAKTAFTWSDSNRREYTVVTALTKIPHSDYAQKIASL